VVWGEFDSKGKEGRKEGRKEGGGGEIYIKMSVMICTAGETELG